MNVKYLWPYLRPYRKQLVVGPLFKLIEAVLEITLPILMARLIDRGITMGDRDMILRTAGQMLLIALTGFVSALVCQYYASVASQGFGTVLRGAMLRHINALSFAERERFGSQTLGNRLINDINQLQQAVAMLIRLVVRAPFICVGSIVACLMIRPSLALVVVATVPIFSLILIFLMRRTFPLYRRVQERLDAIASVLRENLAGVRVIRAFARRDHEERRFGEANDRWADTAVGVGRIAALMNPMTTLIINGAIIVILWLGGAQVETGRLTQGEVVAFVNYLTQVLLTLIVLANLIILFTRASASLVRVREVLAVTPGMPERRPGSPPSPWDDGAPAICFDRVSFGYPRRDAEKAPDAADEDFALSDLSFTVARGETLGIIGGTGSGKSTVAALCERFYDATSGAVLIGGRDVRDWELRDLRAQIGLVAQRVELFAGTVADNIRMGNRDADDAALLKAAETAQAAAFIERLPGGLMAPVARGGRNLSGGQRQRVALARAIVRRPAILILDDAASALDYATEAALWRALRRDLAGTTVMMISQRAAALRRMDRILVLDNGRAVGLGTHDELMDACPLYQSIVHSQQPEEEGA